MVHNTHQPRVLVGLDSQSRALDIPGALARYGFEVRSAFEGDAVLRLAESWEPQSAVIELSIPGTPALEVGRALRRHLGRRIRLVGMTGLTDAHYRKEAINAGFDDVVLGPANPTEILLALGGASAKLVMRHRSALFDQSRQMIALGHRLLDGRPFLSDQAERLRRVTLARRALEWSKSSLHVTPIAQERREEMKLALEGLAARLEAVEAKSPLPSSDSRD